MQSYAARSWSILVIAGYLRKRECEGCGGTITGGFVKGRSRSYAYYGCFNSDCEKRKAIAKKSFEEDFTTFLRQNTPSSPWLKALGEAVMIAFKTETESIVKTNSKLESDILKAKIQKEEIIKLRVRNVISDDDLKEQIERLNEE